MERSDIRVLPSKCEATGHYFQATARPRLPDVRQTAGSPDFATLNPGYLLPTLLARAEPSIVKTEEVIG